MQMMRIAITLIFDALFSYWQSMGFISESSKIDYILLRAGLPSSEQFALFGVELLPILGFLPVHYSSLFLSVVWHVPSYLHRPAGKGTKGSVPATGASPSAP